VNRTAWRIPGGVLLIRDVRYWHLADILGGRLHVRFGG
jgi:hypothetical protein